MNTSLIILIISYILFAGFLGFLFFKNDMDLKKTIRYIKVKFLNCCIKNKKELIEKLGEEKVSELEEEYTNIADCEAPLNFPLDLCLSSDLEVEEIKIRENILKILNERNNYVFDGGKQKLIVPLEATLFLTKSLSPLVTEDGDIQVIAKHTPIERTELEEIKIYIKSLTDENDNPLYEDDKEILDLIKRSISRDIEEKRGSETDISKEIEKIKTEEEKKQVVNTEKIDPSLLKEESDDFIFDEPEEKIDNINDALDKEMDSFSLDDLGAVLDKELEKELEKEPEEIMESTLFDDKPKEKEKESEEMDESAFVIDSNPFGDEEEIDFSELEKEISDEVDSLDFGDEDIEKDEKTRETFYTKRKYTSLKIKRVRKEYIKEDIEEILSKDSVKKAILNNLIKTKPLVFNDNKEVVFVDQKNLIFALSKVYGIEGDKILKDFETYNMKENITLSRAISLGINEYVSDLITGNKKVNRILLEKEKELYFSFGLFLMTKVFLEVLDQDDFDFFRSLPYNTEYKISNSSENTKTPLVPSLSEVEI